MANNVRARLVKKSLYELDKEGLDKIEVMTNSLLAVQNEGDKLIKKTPKNVIRNKIRKKGKN